MESRSIGSLRGFSPFDASRRAVDPVYENGNCSSADHNDPDYDPGQDERAETGYLKAELCLFIHLQFIKKTSRQGFFAWLRMVQSGVPLKWTRLSGD